MYSRYLYVIIVQYLSYLFYEFSSLALVSPPLVILEKVVDGVERERRRERRGEKDRFPMRMRIYIFLVSMCTKAHARTCKRADALLSLSRLPVYK